jgi:glyoxylase-like metal-dependent hydrolase (beta-lactamase superfamily II)
VATASKQPLSIIDSVFAFPPNRETIGGTAYLIVENHGNILVDCPAWEGGNPKFIAAMGGVHWLVLTNRDGKGRAAAVQQQWNCQIIVQEQEAYLLPDCTVTRFEQEHALGDTAQLLWTPGYSPGSACLYYRAAGGILFTGRHLLPNPEGQPMPIKTAKTFHWWRQLQSVEQLRAKFSPDTLKYLCPGANTGFLRGKRLIADAYEHLAQLDLQALRPASGSNPVTGQSF